MGVAHLASRVKVVLFPFFVASAGLSSFGQDFRNLDFEDGTLVPLSGNFPSEVQFDPAFPGWTGTFDQAPEGRTNVDVALYNTMSLDGAAVSIIDTNLFGAPIGLIHRRFCVCLQEGIVSYPIPGGLTTASIAQTGTVPSDASSILFNALLWTNSGATGVPLEVTFAGTLIPWVVVDGNSNYTVLGGDVTRFAGQTGELKFTAPYVQGQPHNSVYLDYIHFSSELLTLRPVILKAPQNQIADVGSGVEFAADATGYQPLAYQWFFNATNALAGATSSALTLTNVEPAQSGFYCVVVTNVFGAVTSAPAMLRVGTLAVARISINQGSSGHYNVMRFTFGGATSFGTLTRGIFGNLLLTTNDVGRILPVTQANDTNFDFVVSLLTNGISDWVGYEIDTPMAGSFHPTREADLFAPLPQGANGIDFGGFHIDNIALEIDQLSFTPLPGGGLVGTDVTGTFRVFVNSVPWLTVIKTSPLNQIADVGSTVDFSVDAVGGPPLSYRWFFNSTNSLSGGTSSVLELVNIQPAQAGAYTVVVYNQFGSVTSSPAILTVIARAPTIRTPPQSQTAEAGSAVRFAVSADGDPPPAYQWFFNEAIPLNGATNAILQLDNIQPTQAGSYTLVVSNAFGTLAATAALLSVIAPVERTWVPGLTLAGEAGISLNLDASDNAAALSNGTLAFDGLVLTNGPQWYFDLSQPLPTHRFYRAWQTGEPNRAPTLDIHMVPALTLTGAIGSSARLDYINRFGPTDAWVTLNTVTLTNTAQLYFDTSASGQPPRLWRIVPLP